MGSTKQREPSEPMRTNTDETELLTQDLLSLNRLVGGAFFPSEVLARLTTYLAGRLNAGACSCYSLVPDSEDPQLECRADAFTPDQVGSRLRGRDLSPAVRALFAPGQIASSYEDSSFGQPPPYLSAVLTALGGDQLGIVVPLVFRRQVVGLQWFTERLDSPYRHSEMALAQCVGVFAGQSIGVEIFGRVHTESQKDHDSLQKSRIDEHIESRMRELREYKEKFLTALKGEAEQQLETLASQAKNLELESSEDRHSRVQTLQKTVEQLRGWFGSLRDAHEEESPATADFALVVDTKVDQVVAEVSEIPIVIAERVDKKEQSLLPEDPFAGILSKSQARVELEELVALSTARGWFISVVALGISNLEELEAEFGSRVTRILLGQIAQVLRESTRSSEPVARWDDGLFLCVLPAASSYAARLVANRLRKRLVSCGAEKAVPLTHIGVATVDPRFPFGTDELVARALQATGAAQRLGDNKVVVVPARNSDDDEDTRKRILIVDDDRAVLRALKRYFTRTSDFAVITASSVTEALETARKTPPQVAILDLKLSDGTGFELLRRLRKLTDAKLPAIAYTGVADDRIVDHANVVGFSACLQKGKIDALASEVQRCLAAVS